MQGFDFWNEEPQNFIKEEGRMSSVTSKIERERQIAFWFKYREGRLVPEKYSKI